MIGTDQATFTEGVAMHNDPNGGAGGLQAAALGWDGEAPLPIPPATPGPSPPFDRERFVVKTLAVVIGRQLLIYSSRPASAASGQWRTGRSPRSVQAPLSSCRAALIPRSTCCWPR